MPFRTTGALVILILIASTGCGTKPKPSSINQPQPSAPNIIENTFFTLEPNSEWGGADTGALRGLLSSMAGDTSDLDKQSEEYTQSVRDFLTTGGYRPTKSRDAAEIVIGVNYNVSYRNEQRTTVSWMVELYQGGKRKVGRSFSSQAELNSILDAITTSEGTPTSSKDYSAQEHINAARSVLNDKTKSADYRYQNGMRHLNRAIKVDPSLKDAYMMRAHVHSTVGDEQDAISDLSEYIRLDPGEWVGFQLRGFQFRKLAAEQENYDVAESQLEKAIHDFKKALSLAPPDKRSTCGESLAEAESVLETVRAQQSQ